MIKRGQLNISFAWLFAIIVGATILILVIFGVTKAINSGQEESSVVGASEISSFLNPLESSFESGTSHPIKTNLASRISFRCISDIGNFGEQRVRLQEFSFNKWQTPGGEISFNNKYIFSEKIIPTPQAEISSGKEGAKTFFLFVKPFEFPFKVADTIYFTAENEKYCFSNAPTHIKQEITQMNQPNLSPECDETNIIESTKICFNQELGCKIIVDYNQGIVTKPGKNPEKIYFTTDALMYASIFSNTEEYECQAKRLMKRVSLLADIYTEKAVLMSQRNCPSFLEEDLKLLKTATENYKQSLDLLQIKNLAENIKKRNEFSTCNLW